MFALLCREKSVSIMCIFPSLPCVRCLVGKREYVMTSLCYERTFRVQSGKRCVYVILSLTCCLLVFCKWLDLSLSILVYRTVVRKCWLSSSRCPAMCVQVVYQERWNSFSDKNACSLPDTSKATSQLKCLVVWLFMSSGRKSWFVGHHTCFASSFLKKEQFNQCFRHPCCKLLGRKRQHGESSQSGL